MPVGQAKRPAIPLPRRSGHARIAGVTDSHRAVPEVATHAELSRALVALQAGISASELHGSLTGFLAAGGMSREGAWLHDLALDQVHDAIGGSADRLLFDRLFAASSAELQDPSLSFDLLLPDDEASIEERAVALVEWCRGFLGGLGVSGADLGEGLGGDAGEVLKDISRIAATRFDAGDTAEDDEEAYAEVVEYVRVGVMLLHSQLARPPKEATRH
jgi:uncharacterized protein YgfB (UPF0149 family)